ncbi:MAG: type IV toxin-antitoxin system AbiEi family antitoxin domain-containing protein [Candidatus Micrarchaeota archaeon]
MKYIAKVREHFRRVPVFTISDLKVLFRKIGISKSYLRLLIHNLLAKGEIKKISRGIYSFRSETEVVGFGFRPFYYGLQDALSLHNLWEQETNPVVITPRKVRSGIRNFEGANYVIRRIKREMFFGFTLIKYSDFWIPVSNIEKTVIDFVYFRQQLNIEVLKEIRKKLDWKTLKSYLKRCPLWVKNGVLKACGLS